MALATYADLKRALARLLNRQDLGEDIAQFVALFEADFDANPATARHRRRVCRAQATIAAEYEALPGNYLAVQSIGLATAPTRWLQYADPDSLERLVQDEAAWRAVSPEPFCYSIVGTELRFFPAPQRAYPCNLTVYERLEPLTDEGDSNWLLRWFPNLYVYGSALHSAPFLGADERAGMWKSFYDEAWDKLSASDPEPTSKLALRTDIVALTGPQARSI